jgi:O-antigen ligase
LDLVAGVPVVGRNERNYWIFWILSLVSIPVLIFFAGDSLGSYRLLIVPLLLVCMAAVLNYEITLGIFIISLFVDAWLLYARPSEVYALLLILSFLLAYKFSLKDLDNELNKYFLLFVLCCFPSFLNYNNPITYLSVIRLLVFFLVYLVVSVSSTNLEKINKIFNVFIVMSVLNGLTVIYFALLTGKRVYGFSGIMYVDYVGIGLTLCLIKILYSDRFKIMWITAFIIQLLALIFTQTRNAWITSGLILLCIIFQFIFFNKKLKIAAIKKVILSFSILLIVLLVTFQAGRLNPTTYERLSSGKPNSDNELRINTFVTRVFIWNTAWNAFKSNPVIGVGLYNFKFVSRQYNTIDPVLYKLFVEKVSPHETFLEILCETGIIGFMGFSFFLFPWLRTARNNLKICNNEQELYFARMIFWSSIFILFSMVMTDIWLQGHGLMLWGIIVGLSIAFRKIVNRNSTISISI